jgi:hypothetical protein
LFRRIYDLISKVNFSLSDPYGTDTSKNTLAVNMNVKGIGVPHYRKGQMRLHHSKLAVPIHGKSRFVYINFLMKDKTSVYPSSPLKPRTPEMPARFSCEH